QLGVLLKHADQQLFLVAEVVVHAAGVDARVLEDLRDAGGFVALLPEQFAGCFQQSQAGFGCGGGVHGGHGTRLERSFKSNPGNENGRRAVARRPLRGCYLIRFLTQASISASLPLPTTIIATLPSLFTMAMVGMPVTP